MTPVSPKPSMHDIVSGFWDPTPIDIANGLRLGFGATINVFNGEEECVGYTQKAQYRTSYYDSLLTYLNVPKDLWEDNNCYAQVT